MEARRGIQSFVLRQGRLTPGQKHALEELWPVYGLDLAVGMIDPSVVFGRKAQVTLEIGFGMGDSLLEQAVANPDRDYLGIEVHKPGVGHLLLKMKEAGCSNIRIYSEDSIQVLQQVIPDQVVDTVQLFFPDPWPKKRHHKRRIVNTAFLTLIKRKLRSGGVFHMATDWAPYAEDVAALLKTQEAYEPVSPPPRAQTKFERRGLKLGHEIRDLAFSVS